MILLGYLLAILFHVSRCHQCYKCGPLNEGFIATCEHFNVRLFDYIATCPSKYQSCSTQFRGSTIIRQCENVKHINDCKIANGVKYCYCTSHLCNGNNIVDTIERNNNIPTDDEDILEEGSGFSSLNKEFTVNQVNLTTKEASKGRTVTNDVSVLFFTHLLASSLALLY